MRSCEGDSGQLRLCGFRYLKGYRSTSTTICVDNDLPGAWPEIGRNDNFHPLVSILARRSSCAADSANALQIAPPEDDLYGIEVIQAKRVACNGHHRIGRCVSWHYGRYTRR